MIKSISDLLLKLETYQVDMNSQRFFRGHSDAEYRFIPTVFREKGFFENEHNIFNDVLIECSNDFRDCITNSEKLVKMQHYGSATRLLDITTNPLVALYFSCIGSTDTDGCILIIDARKKNIKTFDSDSVSILSALPRLNSQSKAILKKRADESMKSLDPLSEKIKKFNDLDLPENTPLVRLIYEIRKEKPAFENTINPQDILEPVIFRPQKSNDRIVRQNGAFVLFGLESDYKVTLPQKLSSQSDLTPLEYESKEETYKFIFLKVSKSEKKKILKELNTLGITEASIFPELYKVASYINAKYS